MIKNAIKNPVTAVVSLYMMNLENPQNQNSKIAANTSEAGTLNADSQVGWHDRFQMFWSYFLLKIENYPNFAFVQSLFSTKTCPKVVNLPLTEEKLCLSV